MKIKRLVVGSLETNCYILEKDNELLIIDPGDDCSIIKKEIKDKKLIGILITHHHFDHIGALQELINEYDVPIYDYHILDNHKIKVGNFEFVVIHTPGHTSDSVTFDFTSDKIMFTGDFLFKGTIGRTDLDTGDMNIMKMSIDRIKKYNDSKIYPGHGDVTTLEAEKRNNIYFRY